MCWNEYTQKYYLMYSKILSSISYIRCIYIYIYLFIYDLQALWYLQTVYNFWRSKALISTRDDYFMCSPRSLYKMWLSSVSSVYWLVYAGDTFLCVICVNCMFSTYKHDFHKTFTLSQALFAVRSTILMLVPSEGICDLSVYSVVGRATCYGLHGPGIESRFGRDFPHSPGTILGPTQPLTQ
jgi:hypothetical protein